MLPNLNNSWLCCYCVQLRCGYLGCYITEVFFRSAMFSYVSNPAQYARIAYLALVSHFIMFTNLRTSTIFACRTLPIVFTNLRTATIFAFLAHLIVFADFRTSTIFAFWTPLIVLADLRTSTIFACCTLPFVLTHLRTSAFCTYPTLFFVLTDLRTFTIYTVSTLFVVLTNLRFISTIQPAVNSIKGYDVDLFPCPQCFFCCWTCLLNKNYVKVFNSKSAHMHVQTSFFSICPLFGLAPVFAHTLCECSASRPDILEIVNIINNLIHAAAGVYLEAHTLWLYVVKCGSLKGK